MRWQRAESRSPLLIAVSDFDRLTIPIDRWASHLFEGGVDVIQIRQPELNDELLGSIVERIVSNAPSASHVQINNRPDLAQRFGCGIHFPARAKRDAPFTLPSSRSVHSLEAARTSEAVDFLIAGHVFSTPSHAGEPGRGIEWLRQIVGAAAVPVVAIGGINATNAVSCLEAGAAGVAVIRALTVAIDLSGAARSLREILDSFAPEPEIEMNPDSIEITLNGKPVQRPARSSIQDLLHDRELVDRLVVVEVNGSIIPRSAFTVTIFDDGDIVELVHFVGGG